MLLINVLRKVCLWFLRCLFDVCLGIVWFQGLLPNKPKKKTKQIQKEDIEKIYLNPIEFQQIKKLPLAFKYLFACFCSWVVLLLVFAVEPTITASYFCCGFLVVYSANQIALYRPFTPFFTQLRTNKPLPIFCLYLFLQF